LITRLKDVRQGFVEGGGGSGKAMRCPLRGFELCIKRECAWWSIVDERCAVNAILEHLREVRWRRVN
jgi:hypothetical protein